MGLFAFLFASQAAALHMTTDCLPSAAHCLRLLIYLFEDALGGGARFRAVGDGAANDDEISAIADGVGGCGDALLVAALRRPCGPYARRQNDEALRGDTLADQAYLVRRGDDAIQPAVARHCG